MTSTHTTVQTPLTAEQLLNALQSFVQAQVTPDVTAEFAELPGDIVKPLLDEWHQADQVLDLAKSARDAVKQKFVDLMAGAEAIKIAETGQEVVTYRENTAMVLDTAKLKKEHPEITENYLRPRTQRPFNVLV